MTDPIRTAIQNLLDSHDDGWTVAEYVVCLGLERIHDGQLEYTTWHYCPPDQADWKTDALIDKAAAARAVYEWNDE